MQDDSAFRLAKSPALAFAALIAFALVIGLTFVRTPRPDNDALRYIDYAINLHDYGVFSAERDARSEPTPGSIHTPLYPAWVAIFMHLDPGVRASLACFRGHGGTAAACSFDFTLLVAAQLALAGVFFGAVWLLALRLSGSASIAWMAAGFALLSRSPLQYPKHVLTEALLLPLLALFTVFLVIAYQEKKTRWMLAAGAALGLAALTRPAYAYLFFAVAAVMATGALVKRRPALLAVGLAFALAYGVVVAPWLVRNKLHFDRFALTSSYAGDILSQRIAYNRMGWTEFWVSWLYWFPDFGDHLAKRLLSRHSFDKLGWDEGSYYATVAPALYDQALAEAKSPDAVLPHLIRAEILGNPVKHALVTLPLAWRGIFIGKYWGIAGLICFYVVVVRHWRRREHALLVASLPVWFMVAFHALFSVSIPRYNLALTPLYAYALACCAQAAARRIAIYWDSVRPSPR